MPPVELLYKIASDLLDSSNVGASLDAAARTLLDAIGFDIAARWRADYDALVLHCVDFHPRQGAAPNCAELKRLSLKKALHAGEGGPGRVWLSRNVLYIPELEKESEFPRLLFATRCGMKSYVALPLVFEKHVFGCLEFFSSLGFALDQAQLPLLQAAGRHIGQFLYKQGFDAVLTSVPTQPTLASNLSTEAIITIDGDSRITLINEQACALFGYSRRELIGESLTLLIPEEYRARHLHGLGRYLATGTHNISWDGIRLPALHKNGTIVPVEISFGEVIIGERRLFSGYVRKIPKD